MGEAAIISITVPVVSMATIGFICYVYFTTRAKQRMLMIEKGVDASFFNSGPKKTNYALTFGLLLLAVGLGVFLGYLLSIMGMQEGVAYNGSIFILGGLGLLLNHAINKREHK